MAAAAPPPKLEGSLEVPPPSKKPEKKLVKLHFGEDFVLSGCAAVTSKTLAAPIERLKMVKQNEDELVKRGTLERPFRSIIECASWINRNEGFLSFWKSNFTNCVRYFPTQALNFALLPLFKQIKALKALEHDSFALKLLKNSVSGGLAGTTSLLFVYSLDYARTRLANDLKSSKKGAAPREFNGLLDVYKKTFATDGVQGLYRGFVISAVGIFIYRGLYFGLYHTIMPLFPEDGDSFLMRHFPAPAVRFVVAYCVTVTAGLASYPIDTIRRRMMMTSGGDKSLQYKGSWDCTRYILKKDGPLAFFKGAGANILRGVAGAGVLALFDSFVQAYVQLRYGEGYTAKISGGGG